MSKWEDAKASNLDRLKIVSHIRKDQALQLIQAAEEEIARKDNQLDVMVEVNQEKEKEITRLREVESKCYEILRYGPAACITGEIFGHLDELREILYRDKINAFKENGDEL